jgi:hypothetical protein
MSELGIVIGVLIFACLFTTIGGLILWLLGDYSP